MPELTGKLCLVTGAANGIGAAIAAAFVDEGARVIVTDRNPEAGARAAEAIGADFEPLDVASEADWDRLAEKVPALDVLVNNAGISGLEARGDVAPAAQDPENVSLEDWQRVHAVNLDGTFLGCRYAIRAMRKNGGGSIINMSSRSGMVGIPLAAAYASSKAAIRNHTKSVALYCAGKGLKIRCNSIHPGAILTPMWEPMLGDGPDRADREAAMVADIPLKRFGKPEEIAGLAVYLASDRSGYMTGAELTMDGGILAGSAAVPGD